MHKIQISSGAKYEDIVGYSRAIRIANMIYVSGTAPIAKDGRTSFPGDLYKQTQRCLDIIREAIEKAGGSMEDIVRTRVYLTDASRWEEAGRAHGEVFQNIKPTCTFVEVSGLLKEDWMVEIEAEAVTKEY